MNPKIEPRGDSLIVVFEVMFGRATIMLGAVDSEEAANLLVAEAVRREAEKAIAFAEFRSRAEVAGARAALALLDTGDVEQAYGAYAPVAWCEWELRLAPVDVLTLAGRTPCFATAKLPPLVMRRAEA